MNYIHTFVGLVALLNDIRSSMLSLSDSARRVDDSCAWGTISTRWQLPDWTSYHLNKLSRRCRISSVWL